MAGHTIQHSSKCKDKEILYKRHMGAAGTEMLTGSEHLICALKGRMDKHGISTKRPIGVKRASMLRPSNLGGWSDVRHAPSSHFETKTRITRT